MNLEFIEPQNLGFLLIKSSQSNFSLRSPGSYLVCIYTTVTCPHEEVSTNWGKLLTYFMDGPQMDYLELLASDVLMDSYRPCNNLKKI